MIDTTKISKIDQILLARPLLNAVTKFFENPTNQQEFEIWQKNRIINQKAS